MLQPAPGGIDVPRRDRNNPYWEAVMSKIITVGLDLAKNVFQASRRRKRRQSYFAQVAQKSSGD